MGDNKHGWTNAIPLVGPIAGAIAGAYDTRQAAKTARENTDKTIAANKAEAELAYQRQVEMWHLQNQYNSPEEQMARFGAAGLNPHLIYGQGNAGNAQGTPNYQPPNMQYKYEAPAYGAAVGSTLPTLMAVGTWMQNMKMSEVDIKSKQTNIEKAQQIIEFLESKYPHEIRAFDQKESLWPYQRDIQDNIARKTRVQVNDVLQKYAYDWTGAAPHNLTGAKGIQLEKLSAEARLKEAQAKWFEPATIMRLVLGSIPMLGKIGRVAPRSAGKATRMIGKGRPGRWSSSQKRWTPSKPSNK